MTPLCYSTLRVHSMATLVEHSRSTLLTQSLLLGPSDFAEMFSGASSLCEHSFRRFPRNECSLRPTSASAARNVSQVACVLDDRTRPRRTRLTCRIPLGSGATPHSRAQTASLGHPPSVHFIPGLWSFAGSSFQTLLEGCWHKFSTFIQRLVHHCSSRLSVGLRL